MTRSIRTRSGSKTRFTSLVLSFSLLISLCAPLTLSRAASAVTSAGTTTSSTPATATSASLTTRQAAQRAGELLVRFRNGISEQEKSALATAKGVRRQGHLRGASNFERLHTGGQTSQQLLSELATHPSVEWVEPNFLITRDDLTPRQTATRIPVYLPNLPRRTEPWARVAGSTPSQSGSGLVSPAAAWKPSMAPTGSGMTIAVVDSGIDFTHPELSSSRWENTSERANERDDDRDGYVDDLHGWDWVADSNQIKDEQGHGTSVAGLVVAEVKRASSATAGGPQQARLMSLRVLDNTGTGDVADAVEAIDYAVARGARVINLSWGLEAESLALRDAIERAAARGVVVVCSAGNHGRNIDGAPYYPASFELPNLIAVAASDSADNLASWSNWGAARVTVAAAGVDVSTTKMGGGEQRVTGTSAAAPQVSGIAALVRDAYPALDPAQTRAAVMRGARPVAGLSGKVTAGGVAQAAGAISAAGGIVSGTGGGNDGGDHGNGNGNGGQPDGAQGSGNGQGQGPSPRPGAPGHGSGGRGPNGSFDVTPPAVTKGAPANLPNLDNVRKLRNTEPKAPEPSSTISANLVCADCDPDGGGGGGYVPSGDPRYSTARTYPVNETGQSGVDLGSRNFNWSTPLVGLEGRAGLNLGLSLHYNSLVWTRQGYGVKFNADRGFPGPGFRLGFANIQQRYYNSQVGVYSYMMLTPAGGRVELRQVGTSNVYEAQDGSYTQLIDNGNGTALVRTKDGTQLSFTTINGEMRCYQIMDRNGNYITVNYDGYGHVTSVVDTLGRIVNFNYDGNANLSSITQTWNGTTHTWATFTYGSLYLQGNFPGLYVNGPNNSYITVLTQVGLHDGSYYAFNYNSWGQVYRITQHAADGHARNYTSYNLPLNSSTGHSDCPRFTERRDWAENWNGGAEAITSYSVATDNSWSQVTTPDGTIYKEFFGTTGWQSGLTTQAEVWSGGQRKKWTTTAWTQDNLGVNYRINPRPTEINIYDSDNNRRRTTISYTSYSLPEMVREWGGANADQVLRRTYTHYRWDDPYISRRIIGLLGSTLVYEGENTLVSKLEYHYDWDTHFTALSPGMQHTALNYFYGRGALVGVRRYNLNAPDDPNQGDWPEFYGYDHAGSVLWTQDGAGHRVNFSYSDNYANTGHNSLNTRAYPTTTTDADGFSSTTQYNYDTGAVTRTQGPPPAGQTQGAIQVMEYDGAGRIQRVTNSNNGAYTRWYYPASQDYVQIYETIEGGQPEAYSITYFDGAGRPRAAAQSHPGSAGGYTATSTIYDVLGRVVQQTKPTEITAAWVPAGDDAAGWVWTTQQYDWQGRPTLTTYPNGNTVQASYGGCGCAGGDVTTTRDERGRRRKLYKDTLGRLVKVEEMNWLENEGVYATTTYAYNGRDQLTTINQGAQVRTFEYDARGRLWRKTTPEQGATTYEYNGDDTLYRMTDARGASTTYTYNGRHLPTFVDYAAAGGAAQTADVSLTYDAAGNRTSMTDGLGSVSYTYNSLSQLAWETRTFTGIGSYTFSYGYNLAGQLTSMTNPWNVQIYYAYDAEGRPTTVYGANYSNVTYYAHSLKYRAWGALKQATYGNGHALSKSFDNRMRLTGWHVANVMGWNYDYDKFNEKSARVTYAQSTVDATLNRSYDYDQVGRLWEEHSGNEADAHVAGQPFPSPNGPLSHSYRYDQYGNMTYRVGWGGTFGSYTNQYRTFTNNRQDGLIYDAAGNLKNDGAQYTYDVTGQQVDASQYPAGWGGYPSYSLQQSYDGDGQRVKKVDNGATTYALRSSALGGQVVAELQFFHNGWNWARGYVYLGGQLLGIQASNTVTWVHQDPVVKSQRLTNTAGTITAGIELDAWGGETTRSWNSGQQPRKYTSYERDGNGNDQAGMRNYHSYWMRFDQPDPYDGSAKLTDPQSFNRYNYVQNDPVNFVDPSGLNMCSAENSFESCGGNDGFWGGGFGFGDHVAEAGRVYGDLAYITEGLILHQQRVDNARGGYGFVTTAEVMRALGGPDVNVLCFAGTCWSDGMGTITTASSLNWSERVLSRARSLQFNGWANAVTFDLPNRIDRWMGRTGPEAQAWLESQPEYQSGSKAGVVSSMVVPGGGLRGVAGALRVTFGHGARHLAGTGLGRRVVERAIRADVRAAAGSASTTGAFWGRVNVGGRTVEYRAFTLPNGRINVGTYYIPPGF